MSQSPLIAFSDRPSDSALVERVWQSRSGQAGRFHSIATCHWEMVVSRVAGETFLTVRGPETEATSAELPPDGEWFAIRFRFGTCMPALPPGQLRDCNAVTLPGASPRSFWLNGSAVEYPTFANAETFVNRLARAGLIVADPVVQRVMSGGVFPASVRTVERRFRHVTGLTHGIARQIERARRATLLLRQGVSALDAAYAAGYYDQAHLVRSLRRFVGQTPTEIAQARQQLSFLYNTGAVAE